MKRSRRRERIAFVELWRFGDSVLATAGLRSLRKARPDAEIALVSDPRFSDPLVRSGDYDIHVPFAPFWTRGRLARDKYLPWTIDYGEVYRAWRALRAFDADTTLLFRGDPREEAFFRSTCRRVADLRLRFRTLPGVRVFECPPGLHRYQEYVHLVSQWSGTTLTETPQLADVVPYRDARGPYVILHPGASWEFKQWSPRKIASLADRLQDAGHRVMVVGGSNDRATIDAIGRASTSAPEAQFPSTAALYALIAGASAVVCNNSAALHIAEALDIPCVLLNGPTDPQRFGTFRAHSVTVCRSIGLPCHPCFERRCVTPAAPCIDRIELSEVLDALDRIGVAAMMR